MALPTATRVLALSSLILIAAAATGVNGEATRTDPTATPSKTLTQQMARFVAGLDAEQRQRALYAFDDAERFDLRLAPMGLEGLRIDEMSDGQWLALESMLGSVLSPTGLEKMNTIRSLEREVAATEGGLFGFFTGWMRDVERYFLTVYGAPSRESPWGLRFDGHHLSLDWTVVPGAAISATPLFFGAQPRVVPADLERAGLRVLADEEERAVELVNGLPPDQRERARIPLVHGSAIRRPMSIGGELDLTLPTEPGLRRADLDPLARERFDRLVEVHLASFVPDVADRYRAQILGGTGDARFVFAAAGEQAVAGQSLYYRIQGGGFMIEFDDTSEAADHIHVVLRNPTNDFGRDVLAEHLAGHHEGDR